MALSLDDLKKKKRGAATSGAASSSLPPKDRKLKGPWESPTTQVAASDSVEVQHQQECPLGQADAAVVGSVKASVIGDGLGDPTLRTSSELLPNAYHPPSIPLATTKQPHSDDLASTAHPLNNDLATAKHALSDHLAEAPEEAAPGDIHLATTYYPLSNTDQLTIETGGKKGAYHPPSIPLATTKQPHSDDLHACVPKGTPLSTSLAQPLTAPLASTEHPHSRSTSPERKVLNLRSVVGQKRQILLYLFYSTNMETDRVTKPISLPVMATALNTTENSIYVAMNRMKKEGFFTSFDSKKSRGGWAMYELNESIFLQLIKALASGELSSIAYQPLSNPLAQPLATTSSSSGINKSETFKTTTDDDPNYLPSEWEIIDYSCLAHLNFGRSHLIVLRKETQLSAEQVQSSIKMFHHDLFSDAGKKWKNPLSVLMKCLRVQKQPWTSGTYVSEEDRILEAHYAQLARRESGRQEKIRQILASRYRPWRDKLSLEDIQKLVPEFTVDSTNVEGVEELLKEHFKQTYGAQILQEIAQMPEGISGNA